MLPDSDALRSLHKIINAQLYEMSEIVETLLNPYSEGAVICVFLTFVETCLTLITRMYDNHLTKRC